MKISFVTCDVFTDRPFTGNPLLVVPDARKMTAGQMQAVAREINYSESTFVLPPADPKNAYLQRTFVPVKEIPYAGPPTVGTAVVMASLGKVAPGTADGTTKITIEVGFGPLAKIVLHRISEPAITGVRSPLSGRAREQSRVETGGLCNDLGCERLCLGQTRFVELICLVKHDERAHGQRAGPGQ